MIKYGTGTGKAPCRTDKQVLCHYYSNVSIIRENTEFTEVLLVKDLTLILDISRLVRFVIAINIIRQNVCT